MNRVIKMLVCVVLICLVQNNTAYAQGTSDIEDDPQSGVSMSNDYTVDDGGELFGWFSLQHSSDANPYTGLSYTHSSQNASRFITNAIDVSKHNGNINWNSVKAAGIDYAMIRVAYRGYASSGTLNEDAMFRTNIQGALNAGLKVGVYIFSQATSRAEAVEEANYILSRISGYNISLPVVIDFEYASTSSGTGGRLYDANLDIDTATAVCSAFCEQVASAGYTPMIYANKSMLEKHVRGDVLGRYYKIWLANYTTFSTYGGVYDVWQYSSSGTVNGISGRVDCNFWYEDSFSTYEGVDYSAVYDFDYYINKYSDVKNRYGNDPHGAIQHFVEFGMGEGRQGCENFNVTTYKNRYVDLRNVYGNDLSKYYIHYINTGAAEGRSGSGTSDLQGAVSTYSGIDYAAVYDYNYYISKNPDIFVAYGNDDVAILQHFVLTGMSEGRQANEEFNVNTYKNRYPDLRAIYRKDWKKYYMHYIVMGKAEGRNGSGTSEVNGAMTVYNGTDYSSVYNYSYYVSKNPDIGAAYGDDEEKVLTHFVQQGMKEGRLGSEEFNVAAYRKQYSDLDAAYGDDLEKYYLHYMYTGKSEGRCGTTIVQDKTTVYEGIDYSNVYEYDYYVNNNPDIYAVFGNDYEAVLRHFVQQGMREGRQASQEFNVYIYRHNYPDLESVYGDNLNEYYIHYMYTGKQEGRTANVQNVMNFQLENMLGEKVEQEVEELIKTEPHVPTEDETEPDVELNETPEIESNFETEVKSESETEMEMEGEQGGNESVDVEKDDNSSEELEQKNEAGENPNIEVNIESKQE